MNETLLIALAACCAMGVAATGCGNESVAIIPGTSAPVSEAVMTTSSVQDTTVNLSATAEYEDGVVTVTGEATVPDGARIDWEVGDSFQNDSRGLAAVVNGAVVVVGGRFTFQADVAAFPATMDPIPVWIGFQMIDQPADATALYGDAAQNMKGPQMMTFGNFRRAELNIEAVR